MKQLKVTTIDEIRQRTAEQVQELPGFGDGEPFVAKLRRVSLLDMAKSGDIPNELLGTVSELYNKGATGVKGLADVAKSYHFIAEKSLVEPSYQELTDAGLTLTDSQLLGIYLYSVGGAAALKTFRGQ